MGRAIKMETPPLAPLSKSVKRVAILGFIFFVWALVIALRLLQLQVFQHDKYRHLADIQRADGRPTLSEGP